MVEAFDHDPHSTSGAIGSVACLLMQVVFEGVFVLWTRVGKDLNGFTLHFGLEREQFGGDGGRLFDFALG
ncbi:MAG: hypothetical protein EON58_22180 [Alphaproteobacteria bacterium]|nr:MAG: hypothetical protein EON58_22180 [Alphaproteobacteria bacterium]